MVWGSLRWSDVQRMALDSVVLDGGALMGWCWRTKSSVRGMAWAMISSGLYSRKWTEFLYEAICQLRGQRKGITGPVRRGWRPRVPLHRGTAHVDEALFTASVVLETADCHDASTDEESSSDDETCLDGIIHDLDSDRDSESAASSDPGEEQEDEDVQVPLQELEAFAGPWILNTVTGCVHKALWIAERDCWTLACRPASTMCSHYEQWFLDGNCEAFLQECGLPESCVAALVSSGYDSRETFGQAFLDTAALERFIKHFLTILKAAGEVAGDMWDIHPVAGKLRGVWSKCRPTTEPVSVKPSSQALAVPGLLCSQPQKIQAADRCRLKKELESMYSSAVITPATMPALSLLQTIHLQVESKNWEWLPWKRLLSEDALLEMKGRRSQASGNELQLVQALECAAGVYREEWDLDLGPSAMRVQHLLETRSHAYVMCGAGHLGHWNVYVKKFMGYYCKRPSDGFRPPSVQEAEAADRVAMEEAFGLCFGGHDLNDALNHVSMDRDLLRHLLVEKPKVSSRPPLKRPAPFPGGKTRPDKPDKDVVTDLAGDGAAVSSEQSQSLIGASPSPEPAAVAGNPAVCAESAKAFRWRLRDGGGVGSDADWGSPREETDVLSALRVEWLRLIHDWHLVPRLLKAVAERSKDAWLSEEEVHILREVLVSFLKSRGLKCSAAIEPGQPLALELWEGLFSLCGDVDQQLPSLLREGVPTGILRTIPPSGVWRETEVPERPNLELHTFDTPWGSAREDCHTACELVEEDVKAGFAVWLDGGLAEAKKQFGDNCAAGRLGVVKKAG
ncbi:unnamed protein product, partial [Symbiodinium microadriaticum]